VPAQAASNCNSIGISLCVRVRGANGRVIEFDVDHDFTFVVCAFVVSGLNNAFDFICHLFG